ncbi:unnamed protein product [Spirodela intermedia]|uniref:ZF-HD dimerization-type domain-containing protein n=1 Tax=Spirodela intermedia TaxID=51605 RepID=A0A7I8ILG3_SPIIN|nr:unnamed protein product [Spirodela intermedia]CAA6658766.1 unnamed protein product [Spirodela intermedia]
MELHDDHLRRSPSPPPADHKLPLVETGPFLPLSFPNGALRKNGHHVVYRECMKNHAAAMGCHAVDGCGEFMPSAASDLADPASFTCAACGCHRNFHRRVLHAGPLAAAVATRRHSHRSEREGEDYGYRSSSTAPQAQMLVAFSGGLRRGPAFDPSPPAQDGAAPLRKRARTKFSEEQKQRMKELSERLGWRMQKGDGALVERACREIGVSQGVFKVWMHNNKHIFVGGSSSRRGGGV